MRMKNTANIFLLLLLTLAMSVSCRKERQTEEKAEFYITSAPEEAKIIINNIEAGVTPKTLKLKPAVYILEIAKLNYKSSWGKLNAVPNTKKNIEVILSPVTSSVMINSNPEGAAVIIEGRQTGETPIILHEQTIGKHSAQISKPGFVTQEVSWTIEDARPQQLSCSLFSNMGELSVTSVPSEANVILDGKPRGRTPFTENIEQGEHKLRVEKNGFNIHEQTVVVPRDRKKDIKVELQILPGSLAVTTEPPGAAVFLNDNPYQKTPAVIDNLQPGEYTLKVERDGFDPDTRKVTITPGQRSEVSFVLGSNTGGIDLIVNPPGVTIYFDGKKIGVSETGENKYTSKVFEIRNVSSQEHTIKIAHKRASPPEKSITIQVNKGQITRPKPVTLWIADTYLKLKNGRIMHGKLRQENPEEIIFEPELGIAQRYGREEIEVMRELAENE